MGVFRDVVAAEIDQAVRVTGIVAVAALAAAVVLAVGLARRILTPLDEVTRAAREITESDLARRLDVHGDDEVAELSRTFNAMLDRLQAAFATQRAFVDDAGHELRTPITVVRGHLELLDDADPVERAETQALLLDELDRMHRIVEDLLTLARAEQPDFVRPAPFDLDELTTGVHRRARALSTEHTWQPRRRRARPGGRRRAAAHPGAGPAGRQRGAAHAARHRHRHRLGAGPAP